MKEYLRKAERESRLDVYGLGKDRAKWVATLERFTELILKQHQALQDKNCVAIVNEGMGGIEWLSHPLPDDTPLYATPPHYWGNVTNAELVEELRRRDMIMIPIKEKNT